MLIQDLLSLIGVWFSSRSWKAILLLSCLPALLLIAIVSLAILGATRDENELAANYLQLVSEKIGTEDLSAVGEDDSSAAIDLNPENALDDEASMLLRRVLQTQSYNSRATFLIAQDLVRNGRLAAAKNMLRRIAPQEEPGYLPAHALLATLALEEMRQSGQQPSKEGLKTLATDLSAAAEWEAVSPGLIATYAKTLDQQGKSAEAIELLKGKVAQHPDLQLVIADLAGGTGNEREFRKAKYESKKLLVDRIKSGEAQPNDFAALGGIYLNEQDFDSTRKLALAGLREFASLENEEVREKTKAGFRNLLSLAYLGSFMSSAKQNGSQTSVNLNLLEKALQADPTNPDVLMTVQNFVQQGQMASETLLRSLRYSLADGSATEVTHLMLANHHLAQGDRGQALPHLEMALGRNENNSITLNNLAFALMDGNEEERKRSLELVDRALSLLPASVKTPEQQKFVDAYRASMFDTKGQVLEKMGEKTKAILAYEDAVKVKTDKLNTRERLAEAYRAAGMKEMAETQLERISAIKKELEESKSESAASVTQ